MPRRPPAKPPDPVEAEELKNALLRMIVEKFGDRPLTWETAEKALAAASFEIKMAALRGSPAGGRPTAAGRTSARAVRRGG